MVTVVMIEYTAEVDLENAGAGVAVADVTF